MATFTGPELCGLTATDAVAALKSGDVSPTEMLEAALDRAKFNQRINSLKKPSHGQILLGSRQGWYEFSEKMIRGYVRLRAAEVGVDLGTDHPRALRAAD